MENAKKVEGASSGTSALSAGLARTSEALHATVCQAVTLLNSAPEVARCAEGREARDILRQALANYADAYMDQPVSEGELSRISSKHRRANI